MNREFFVPPVGPIDLHSHLLPGVDDGCRSLDESVECVRRLVECGFAGTVCTPHLWPASFPDNTPESVARAVPRLQEQLQTAGLDYPLWSGGELRMEEQTIAWVEHVGVPTLGRGHCVLVDYWGPSWPSFADDLLRYLIERGCQPILAHPERLGFEIVELDALLRSLRQMGVWLQGNTNSMAGGEGPRAAQQMRLLLAEDVYDMIALDMHRPDSLESRLRGLTMLADEIGPQKLATLIETRPRAVLS